MAKKKKPELIPQITKSGNNIKPAIHNLALVDPEIQKKAATTQDRELLFIRNLYLGLSVKEAAVQAGYAKSTADSVIYVKLKRPAFQEKLRQYAITNDLLNIPAMQIVENKILKHLKKNPLDLPKFQRMWGEKKRIAGILKPEPEVGQMVQININDAQNLFKRVFEAPQMLDDAIDGQIEDSE